MKKDVLIKLTRKMINISISHQIYKKDWKNYLRSNKNNRLTLNNKQQIFFSEAQTL